MADELEPVPGGWFIEYGELRKMRDGKDFIIMTENGNTVIRNDDDLLHAYSYYLNIWDNCRRWGLPNGGDWANCPAWLLAFLKVFDDVYQSIENYRIKKRQR